MNILTKNRTYPFLEGGGEMGELTLNYDWSQTAVGSPDTWPAALRITVSNLLRSRFPMFLFWGEDLVQFYNDAYRPSLGKEGKHPTALGQKGIDCWPEIWDIIYPLIVHVQTTGESTWSEDQLVPIYRNGKIEDVYWTFSYSAVINDEGKTAGVLVTCNETTEKVLNMKQLADSRDQLEFAIEATELGTWDFNPVTNKLSGNHRLKEWFGMPGDEEDVDLSEAVAILSEKDRQRVVDAINQALDYRSGGYYDIEYSLIDPLTQKERIVRAKGRAWFNENRLAYRFNGTLQDVTDQTIAHRKIEESESLFRALIEAAPVAIGLFAGKSLVIEMCNQAFIDIVGKGKSIIGKTLREAMPELVEERQPFLDILDEVFTTGKMFQTFGTKVSIVQDGILKHGYYDFSYTPLFDNSGHVYAILDIAVDVTGQVEGRKKVEESEQQVRSLVESAPFPIGVYSGREMRIVLANQTILDVWGKGNDVIGKLYSEVLPELANQEIYPQLDGVYQTGIPFHAKNQRVDLVVHGKLQPFYFNYSFTPLFDGQGKVYGVMNTAADVTDLNVANQKVEESRRNLHNMILQAPVAMCILKGEDLIVEIANDRMFQIWGKSAKDMLNKPIFEGLPEAREQGFEDLLHNVYNTGETFKAFERPVSLPRGNQVQTVYLNFVYQALHESDGVITGIMAVAIEVTELVLARRKIEEVVTIRTRELAEVNIALRQNNQELEQFAYIASHDLQEPLRKVRTFADMLRANLGELKEPANTYLNKIFTSSARMFQLIQDMLNFSQITEEKKVFVPVDLNAVIQNILTDFELLIEQKKVTLHISRLPAIDAIPLQMLQLFSNLISNAIKFSKNDEDPVITITSGFLTEEEKSEYEGLLSDRKYYLIRVADNGIGFRQQYAEQIFKIFKRLHGKLEYAGTGIGLALCKKITQNHFGDIKATALEGVGAVFSIVLPEKQPVLVNK